MNSIDALGNLDIWTEILQYFHISLTHDSDAEIKEKRGALLRIALLSPSLTTPALDVLWQSMTSLEPVVQIINAKSTFPLGNFLFFQEGRRSPQAGNWVSICHLAQLNTGVEMKLRTDDEKTPSLEGSTRSCL